MLEIFAETQKQDLGLWQILIPAGVGLLAGIAGAYATLIQYREKVDQLEKVEAQKRLSTLEGQFSAMSGQINILLQNSPSNYVQAKSPISLTEKGEELLEESGIKRYIDENYDQLRNDIQEALEPKGDDYSAYDVQELAMSTIKKSVDEKDFVTIKDYAFDKGINLANIELVGGIHLRNKVLESLGFDMPTYLTSDDDGHAHKPPKKKTKRKK